MRQPGRFDSRMRPYAYTNRRHGMPFELNRHRVNHVDGQPNQYPGAYLSPPPESNWRRYPLKYIEIRFILILTCACSLLFRQIGLTPIYLKS